MSKYYDKSRIHLRWRAERTRNAVQRARWKTDIDTHKVESRDAAEVAGFEKEGVVRDDVIEAGTVKHAVRGCITAGFAWVSPRKGLGCYPRECRC